MVLLICSGLQQPSLFLLKYKDVGPESTEGKNRTTLKWLLFLCLPSHSHQGCAIRKAKSGKWPFVLALATVVLRVVRFGPRNVPLQTPLM